MITLCVILAKLFRVRLLYGFIVGVLLDILISIQVLSTIYKEFV